MIDARWASIRTDAVQRCLKGDGPHLDVLEAALAEEAYRSFHSFVSQLWHVHDPASPVEWNFYLSILCDELSAVERGETRHLLICLPPGFAKSLLVSVLFPAWWWLRCPTKRFVTLSGGEDLAIKDNRRMREVVESEWYRKLIAYVDKAHGIPAWRLSSDQNVKRHFESTARGHRQAFGVGGSVTGNRGDGAILDDVSQVRDVLGSPDQVKATLDKAWHRVSAILATRVYDQRVAWSVTIAQRIHELDVPGRMIARAKSGKGPALRVVVLPMRFDPDRDDVHPDDPRTERGELLDPIRMPEAEVAALAEKLDEVPGQASAQLDQRPVPRDGGLIRVEWSSQRYDFDPQRPDTRFPFVIVTCDCTFKRTSKGSFVSFQAWGIRGAQRFLLGEVHDRLDYVESRQALRDFCTMFSPHVVLIEEAAGGTALIRDLRDEIPSIVAITPGKGGDKMSRAQIAAPSWAAGNVFLPQPQFMPSVGAYVAEIRAFPFGPEDRMDAYSQMHIWLAEHHSLTHGTTAVLRNMRNTLASIRR